MHWQRLDRDTTIQVIDNVKSAANAGMFSPGTSEVKRARLSFYKNHSVYKVTNFASLPSFTFEYLSDGTFFYHLDGTEQPIYKVNDMGGLLIDKNNVMEYLTFFFTHVGDEDGDVVVINTPSDMPLLDSLDSAAYDAVFNQHKPPEVHYDGGYDAYEVEANLYKDSQLVRAKIEVDVKGRVKIKGQKMIMQGVLTGGISEATL